MSASPGALGGLRGLVHLRSILGNLGCIVLPDQVAVPKAHDAFNSDGSLVDPRQKQRILDLGRALASVALKLRP
jgi:NAD(P)H-dependent FMN reductase